MPSLTSLPLSLSEMLEARGGPLRELEIWALLCQSAETLQDLIIRGEAVGNKIYQYMVSPNSLMVRDNGTISLAETSANLQVYGSLYAAPELEPSRSQHLTDIAFEKIFVYSLGRTLQVASEFGLKDNEILSISYDLDSLLQAMSERNAAVRLGLIHILEACALQASQNPHKPPHTHTLSALYKSILSKGKKFVSQDSSYGSDQSHQSIINTIPGRARRPRPQMRHRYESRSPRPHSRSRSRSRSRSPSLSRNTGYAVSGGYPSGDGGHLSPQRKEDEGLLTWAEGALPGTLVTSAATSSSNILNTSMASSSSEIMDLGNSQQPQFYQAPSYAAAQSVQKLLGLRQGSPAYQKYIQLKERQLRLRQARSGQRQSTLEDMRGRLMSPTLSHDQDLMDSMSETRSMASLMSYTLGTYKPNLHAQFGSNAALNYGGDTEQEGGSLFESQLSLLFGGNDKGDTLRAKVEEQPMVTAPYLSEAQIQKSKPEAKSQDLPQRQAQPEHKPPPVGQQEIGDRSTEQQAIGPVPATSSKQMEHSEFGADHMSKPVIQVDMPLNGDNPKTAALLRQVTVVHLTGQRLDVRLDPSTTGRQLFDIVIPLIDLDDFFFFGLTYLSDGEYFFLDADTKLHKVSPDGWKEGPKAQTPAVTFTLYVGVKFYPESLTDFRHTSSYHLLYLQLRRDIVEERVVCDPDTLYQLTGLALQAEYSNYSAATMGQNYFLAEKYFSSRAMRRPGSSVLFNRACQEHKSCAGIPSSQAEIEFIKHVRQLPEYGIHFYKLFKTKTHAVTSQIWVGLTQHSLILAEPKNQGRTIVQEHAWGSILKISFNKRRFSIQPKVEVAKGKPPKLSFYTNSYRMGRYLLQMSTDQHRFQIRMRTRPSNMETLIGDMSVELGRHTAEAGVGDDEIGPDVFEPTMAPTLSVDPSQQPLPDHDEDDDEDFEDFGKAVAPHPDPLQYRSPPPYQPPSMAHILDSLHALPDWSDRPGQASPLDLHEHPLEMSLDMSSRSTSLDSAPASKEAEPENPSPPYTSPFYQPLETQIGRQIFEIVLEKEAGHGIGLTIVGGEATNSLDLGIFVKSVAAGGPAHRDGRIMPGDRLIAIGGTSLEGKQHHEAVALIRDSGERVSLLVSQIRPPATIKRREDQSESRLRLKHGLNQTAKGFSPGEANQGDDTNFVGKEEMLRFDDYVNMHKSLSSSDSNQVCNSDEENYPLEPPPTPPIDSSVYPHQHNLSQLPHDRGDENHSGAVRAVQDSNIKMYAVPLEHTQGQAALEDDKGDEVALKPPVYRVYEQATIPLETGKTPAHGLHQGQEEENELLMMREDLELRHMLPDGQLDWSGTGEVSTQGFEGGLTEEDRKDIRLLSDIAALDADDSSSDSDFDTAIKNTIEGTAGKAKSVGGKAVNAVSPMVFRNVDGSKLLRPDSDVIYEVILENREDSLGIIPSSLEEENWDGGGRSFIQDILPGSSADMGGILAPGDRILDIAGESVMGLDVDSVRAKLSAAPPLCTLKVARSAERDALLTDRQPYGLPKEPHHRGESSKRVGEPEGHRHKQVSGGRRQGRGVRGQNSVESISNLITSAPRERTYPLDGNIRIVPPPPPLNISVEDSESNTQSDVDSDVLDSSRSELENIYNNAEERDDNVRENVKKYHRKTPENCLDDDGGGGGQSVVKKAPGSAEKSPLTGSSSSGFKEHLKVLENELDEHLKKEMVSPNSLYGSSNPSSTESIVLSPRKLIEQRQNTLLSQSRMGDERAGKLDDHDDDDDVVVTMYGNHPVSDGPPKIKAAKKLAVSEQPMEKVARDTLKNKAKILDEDPGFGKDLSSSEPELIKVFLEKKGEKTFGFTIAGGVNTGGCYIKQVVLDPALAEGTLRAGDKIIQVNDQDTSMMNHCEAVTLLRQLPESVTLHVLRYPSSVETHKHSNHIQESLRSEDRGSNSSSLESVKEMMKVMDTPKAIIKPYDYQNTATMKQRGVEGHNGNDPEGRRRGDADRDDLRGEPGLMRIDLEKSSSSASNLGISLEELDRHGGTEVCIKKIKDGGIAQEDGRLQVGDRVLQANGVSLVGMTKSQAASVLKDAEGRLELTVSRSVGIKKSSNVEEGGNEGLDAGVLNAAEEKRLPSAENEPKDTKYLSPRTLAISVPVLVSEEWLNDLPLVNLSPGEQGQSRATRVLQGLADLLESGEPYEEYKNLRLMKEAGPCDEAKLAKNKGKNRYRNVLPYDSNRVKLADSENDYINASHLSVQVRGSLLKYIVCQGPLEDSVSDFWTMLWQENSAVVVMLTQMSEVGKVKCHMYWPSTKTEVLQVNDGSFTVRLVRSYSVGDSVVLETTMEEVATGCQREIILLQFLTWPDHGTPDTALPLLKLLQLVHLLERGAPPVIHCSAGIGRTGVFVAVDVALTTIEQDMQIDMYEIVRNLRSQRHGMIQTTEQYLFCYTACMEALLSVDADAGDDVP